MNKHLLGAAVIAAGLALAACGGSDGTAASPAGAGVYGPTSSTAAPPSPDATATSESAHVGTRDTGLGTVLVDGAGRTLYGFTDDATGTSTCVDACAVAWPPSSVPSAALPAGLDATVFSVTTRGDGTFQLKAGKWPLYRFAGDSKPGDTNGQGSGGTWFAAAPDGSLLEA
jgi:predicted lipoprotein with Yx(FWY)xxD motif